MKVLHLIGGLKGGGAENMVYELCRHALAQKSSSMEVVTLSSHNDIARKFQKEGIPVSLHHGKANPLFFVLRSLKRIFDSNPQVIHAHMFHACIVACIARFFRPKSRVVFSLHNSKLIGIHRRILIFLTIPFRHADILLPGTSKKWYCKSVCYTIPNGVDVELYRAGSIDTQKSPFFTIIFAGRLEPQKAPLFIPNLALELRNQCDFRIIIAGEGSLKPELIRKVADYGLADVVDIRPFQENISQALARCHCLILPSNYEGMPLILLEAGAAGLAVVATPEANRAGIITGESGYVVEREAFAEVLKYIIRHPEEAIQKGANLQQRVRSLYTVRHSFSAHSELYQKLVKSRT